MQNNDQPPSASGERERAAYFLRRFKSEERMLGPNEQKALDVALAALASSPGIDAAGQKPVADGETSAILQWIMKQADAAKEPCGSDPESATAVRNSKLAAIAGAAAQALGMVRGPSYAAPPAAQPSAQECKEAVDAELVSIESRADSFATPREAVCALIDWHAEAVPRSAARQSAAWLAEAERLVDFYAESFSKSTDSGKCRQRLAALLDHLKVRT